MGGMPLIATIQRLSALLAVILCCAMVNPAAAQSSAESVAAAKAEVLALLEPFKTNAAAMAKTFWLNPELGYLEYNTAARIQRELTAVGFDIETGIAGIPTAFIASYGSGKPVIALLAEMDALPGQSQAAVARRQVMQGVRHVHSCGHHLYAGAAVSAAMAVKSWLADSGRQGTIRLYGTPAEEGGSGKVYMVRDGAFSDVDAALHWHPAGINAAASVNNNAVMSAKFRFYGKASHASVSPERGRSALDAVEVMNYAVNMMREHISSDARVHYVISNGGDTPNTVPEFAESYYYVRAKSVESVRALWRRVVNAAEGSALATGTRVEYEIIHATYNTLINDSLQKELTANLAQRSPTVQWTADERKFAKDLYATLDNPWIDFNGTEVMTMPHQELFIPGSNDVGDVSWVSPTGGFVAVTWAPATDPHTWQAAAAGGSGIGMKGMHLAAEVLAMTAVRLYLDKALLVAATEEFQRRRGADFKYAPLLGDRQPPLDYRKEDAANSGAK